MWNQGGYGDGYGDQGGGYLNTSNFGSSQLGSTQTAKVRMRADNIMPVTVAQILTADCIDDRYVYDGVTIHQVTVVGLVRSAKESPTSLTYEIDDLSGPLLEVKQFVDNDESISENERVALVRENIYVRVFGNIRTFQGKRNLGAFRVSPISDMNELTSHLLEVIYAHAYWTKTPGMERDPPKPGSNVTLPNSSRQGVGSMTSYSGQVEVGLTPQQQQVLNVIRSSMDEQGMAMVTVGERLKGMPAKVVREAVEFLSSEGHIYSTIDDDHYKATDSM